MSILELKDSTEESILRIAPEKMEQLTEVFENHTPSFEWPNRAAKMPSVDPRTGVIYIPPAAAELIWAAAYQYWVIYGEYTRDQASRKTEFNLLGSRRRIEAQLVYHWALSHYRNPEIPRTEELPAPRSDPPHASDLHVANELFRAAIAWMLHHEIAHLRCGHSTVSARSRDEEKEADLAATSWIFSPDCSDAEREKRALGLCIAILVITSIDLDAGIFDDSTHPKIFHRFDYCLEAVGLDDDVAYAFSVVMLRLHLTTCGHGVPASREAPFKELFGDHLCAVYEADQS